MALFSPEILSTAMIGGKNQNQVKRPFDFKCFQRPRAQNERMWATNAFAYGLR